MYIIGSSPRYCFDTQSRSKIIEHSSHVLYIYYGFVFKTNVFCQCNFYSNRNIVFDDRGSSIEILQLQFRLALNKYLTNNPSHKIRHMHFRSAQIKIPMGNG